MGNFLKIISKLIMAAGYILGASWLVSAIYSLITKNYSSLSTFLFIGVLGCFFIVELIKLIETKFYLTLTSDEIEKIEESKEEFIKGSFSVMKDYKLFSHFAKAVICILLAVIIGMSYYTTTILTKSADHAALNNMMTHKQ